MNWKNYGSIHLRSIQLLVFCLYWFWCVTANDSPDRKNLKPAVKEFDWNSQILWITSCYCNIFQESACWIVTKLHIKESKIYTQMTMHSHTVDLIPPKRNPSKLPPSNLMNLFYCFVWQLESYGLRLPLNCCWLAVR